MAEHLGSTRRRGTRRLLFAAALSAAAVASGASVAAVPASASKAATVRVRIGQAAVIPAGAVLLGPQVPSAEMTVDVVMRPRQVAALESFASLVSTPGSPEYGRFIRPQQFRQLFGPSAASSAAVVQWLRSRGLRPTMLDANGLAYQVTAPAAQLENAFRVRLVRYRIGSRIAFANTSPPLVTGAAASVVQGVVGLSDALQEQHYSQSEVTRPRTRALSTAAPAIRRLTGPQPCSAAKATSTSYGGYTANDLAKAYGFSGLYSGGDEGAGQTVALVEFEPNLTSDVAAYQSCYGTSATVDYKKIDSGSGSGAGHGEAALDIETVIGLAPKATVDVYQAPNSGTGDYDDYSAIVSQDKAKVVSTSWGLCEKYAGPAISETSTLFEEAATQGQTVLAAAGDSGSEGCFQEDMNPRTLAVQDPSSQPFVTGVGGTSLTSIGPPPSQTTWNESAVQDGAGGGGISTAWKMPAYQSLAPATLHVVNKHSSGTACRAATGKFCREVPDVSADADPITGYVVYYNGSWTQVGGTSAAAPLWGAFIALTNASSGCGGKPIGFANPALYKIAGSSSYSSSFSDITTGNNDYTGYGKGLYPAGVGYDMATGLGSPKAAGLTPALCKAYATDKVTVKNPGTQDTKVGTTVRKQIVATDSAGLPLVYTWSNAPLGLKLNRLSGLITGSPTKAGTSAVTVTATDARGKRGSVTFDWVRTG